MSESRGRSGRERWASDHERARQRAAERLSLPLPASENAWLDRHLANCASCAAVAADYGAQQAALHGLAEPIPPRDLWARTAAALDRAERQAGDLPNASVFPGRGGLPGARGARSIRGFRAERRASAFRSAPRGVPPRLLLHRPRRAQSSGFGWVAPFGALAALAIVIVVGGTALLTSSVAPGLTPTRTSAGISAAADSTPAVTPINVGSGEVAWLSPSEDGTYSLNFGEVRQVCPANVQPDCAPISPVAPRQLPSVNATPHTVLRSPSRRQLAIVMTSGKGRGGSLIVVAVPTPPPSTTGVAASAQGDPGSETPVPSLAITASATASEVVALSSPSGPPSSQMASDAAPAASGDASPLVASGSAEGSAAPSELTLASAAGSASASPGAFSSGGSSGVPAATDSAAPASAATTGSEPAGTATPGESSPVPSTPEPTATALAIISDVIIVGETVAYSPDGTMLAFTARPADDSHGPDIYLWRIGEPVARPITTDHASIFSGWLGNRLLGSRAVDESGRPASSAAPGLPDASGATDATTSGAPGDEASASDATGAGGGADSPSDGAAAAPVETPAATPTIPFTSPAGSESPSQAVSALAPGQATAEEATGGSNAEGAASVPPVTGGPGIVLPRSFIVDPASGQETGLAAAAWRPVVDPTGRFVAYWAGTLRYDPLSLTWLPDRGVLALASWPALAATDPTAVLAPVPLLDTGADAIPSGEWDIRWDESGSHIAIWAADAGDLNVGRLSLLTIDPATARVDPNGVSLHGVPALAGFSIGNDRLAWATPPGQDGQGSRVQVLAWSGENAGKIDSQPAPGNNAVIVVR